MPQVACQYPARYLAQYLVKSSPHSLPTMPMVAQSPREELDIDLQKYLLVLKRRWLPTVGVFGLVTALSTLFALSREPVYQAEGKVIVKIDRTPTLTGLDTPGQTSIGKPGAIGSKSDAIATEVEKIYSLPIAKGTVEALDLRNEEGQPLSPVSFLEILTAKPIAGTDMIRISYQDEDPELAAKVVNTLIELYRVKNIQNNQTDASAARQFIAKQLPTHEAAVRQAEANLRRFKEQNRVIVLDEESRETVKAIRQLEDEIAKTRAELATVSARSREFQRRLGMSPEQAVSATALSQSPAVQAISTQIQQVQGQLDLARSRYRPTHPTVMALQRQEADLQARLQSNIRQIAGAPTSASARGLQMGALEQGLTANLVQSEVERMSLISRIQELANLQIAQRNRSNIFPRLEATQRELERQLTASQTTYESLLRKLQEVQVAEDQTIDNIRVVSQALVPEKPASSNQPLIILGGLVLGSTLGLMTAFALDLCDRTVKSIREVQNLLRFPVLGVIPQYDAPFWKPLGMGQPLPMVFQGNDERFANMHHAYHLLQANLRFLSTSVEPRSIVITSSAPGEGKSQVAANLAVAIAQAGRRVLLVDADLRQPTQHKIWQCDNALGLAQVLEQTATLDNAVQPTLSNPFLLTAGEATSTALSRFNPKELESFIETALRSYDTIIFDTPPMSWAADSSLLGKVTDGTLLVIRPKQVEVADVQATRRLIHLSGQKVLGVVVNGVEKHIKPNRYLSTLKDLPEPRMSNPIPIPIPPASHLEQGFQNGKLAIPAETTLTEQ